MDSNPTVPDDAILFSGSADDWVRLFNGQPIAAPGGVLLLFGGERPLDSFVAGLHFVLAFGKTQGGKRPFAGIEHILPKTLGTRDVLTGIESVLQRQATDWDWPQQQIEALHNTLRVHRLATLEGPDVIETLRHVQDGAAVTISSAQAYRFPDTIRTPIASIPTWWGTEYGLNTKGQLYLPHLIELIRHSLKLAKQKHLFVTLFCEEHEPDYNELPSDLQIDPDLTVMVAHTIGDAYSSLGSFQEWVDRVKEEDIGAVRKSIAKVVHEPENQVLVVSALLAANGQFYAAWATVQPHLDKLLNSNGTLLLTLGQTAFNAGDKSWSDMLLKRAIEASIETLEEVNSAYLLAVELRLEDLAQGLLARLSSEYPNNKTTLSHLYYNHCRARDFSAALELAKRLGDEYAIKLCEQLSAPELDLADLFRYAELVGKLENTYVVAAWEAEQRNALSLAREWASKVESDSPLLAEAIRIRIRIIGRITRAQPDKLEDEVVELEKVMRFVAGHPKELPARFQLEELLESGLEEPAIIFLLTTILLKSVRRAFDEIKSRNFDFQIHRDAQSETLSEEDEIEIFFEEILKGIAPSRTIVMGREQVPDHVKPMVSTNLLHSLILILQKASQNFVDDDLQHLTLLLHTIALVSRELNDPSSDLLAVRIAVSLIANSGHFQLARDLAETALLVLPEAQPQHLDWRTGQAWACYADAFHRASNLLAALRCLTLSFLSWQGPALDRDLLNSNYRLAARISRDLGFADFALEMVDFERQIGIATSIDEDLLRQLDEVELSIQVTKVNTNTHPDLLLKLLTKAAELIDQSGTGEMAPLLSLQTGLIRLLRLSGTTIPNQIEQAFTERLNNLSEPLRGSLGRLLIITPTRSDLLTAIQRVASANSLDDLAFQIKPILGLAENAVQAACQQNDIELFILASSLVSQPILSLQLQPQADQGAPLDSTKVQAWFSSIAGNSHDSIRLMDAQSVFKNIAAPSQKSTAKLGEVSLNALQRVTQQDESLLILARAPNGNLCRALINRTDFVGPETLPSATWSPSKYKDWRTSYPRAYGRWDPVSDPFRQEEPSIEDVNRSLESLSVGRFAPPASLCIIPEASLFGFPFHLAGLEQDYLGTLSQVSSAPSIPWLINVRSQLWAGSESRKVWLGSPSSEDWTLFYLRDRLLPSLNEHHFEVIDQEFPVGLENSKIAVVASHGGTGLLDRFRTVTDKMRAYGAEEFAHSLERCGCVVLFICNAGRGDPQIGSSETVGLVSELLRVNVRSIIASAWPLHVKVTEAWLPPFLEHLLSGQMVGYAAHMALHEVRRKYPNPCAWGALQVFGDATFRLI